MLQIDESATYDKNDYLKCLEELQGQSKKDLY